MKYMRKPQYILRHTIGRLVLFFAALGLSFLPTVAQAGCLSDDDCKAGRVCDDGRCRAAPACAADRDCPGELVCEEKVCRAHVVEAVEPVVPPPTMISDPTVTPAPVASVAPTSLSTTLVPSSPAPSTEAESGEGVLGGRFIAGGAAMGYFGGLNRSEEKWLLYGAGLVGRAGYLTTGLWSFSAITDLTLAGFRNPEFAVGLGIGKAYADDPGLGGNGLLEVYFSLRRTPFDGAAVVIGVEVVTLGRGIYGGSRLLLGAGFANTYRLGYGVTN